MTTKPSKTLTFTEEEQLLARAGVPRSAIPTLAAIATYVESGGDTTALDYDLGGKGYGAKAPKGFGKIDPSTGLTASGGSVDEGFLQINSSWWPWLRKHGLKDPQAALLTAAGSAKAGQLIYGNSGFGPWSPDLPKLPAADQPGASTYRGPEASVADWKEALKKAVEGPISLLNPGGVVHAVTSLANPDTWKSLAFGTVFVLGGLGVVALGAAELAKQPAERAAGAAAKAAPAAAAVAA